jgi:hypothetical protein
MRAVAQQRAATLARARRRNQQPSGIKGFMAKLPDAIPGAAKRSKSSSKNPISGMVAALPFAGGAKRGKSSSSSGKRAGRAALVAGAAGLAIKNRDKITSMMKRDGGQEPETPATPPTAASGTGAEDASVSRLDVTPTDVTTPPQPGSAG